MQPASQSQPAVDKRPWISLWLTIHFFIVAFGLVTNIGSSSLQRRLSQVLAPYSIALHQDYGGVPLAMTEGAQLDMNHAIEVHLADAAADQWEVVSLGSQGFLTLVDRRSQNFARMLAVVAEEKNEELVHLIFDHCLLAWRERGQQVDGIRMVRSATLTYLQAVAERAGELPLAASAPQVLFECRVVALDTTRVKLLPVLEKTRRAISVESAP